MKYCPLCNWEIEDGRCTNTISLCLYMGEGTSRDPVREAVLGDMTGDPQNNGDLDTTNYND
jgi:hypothetical protein